LNTEREHPRDGLHQEFNALNTVVFSTPHMHMAPVMTVDLSRKRLPRPVARCATRLLNRLFGFDQFNDVCAQLPPCEAEKNLPSVFLGALGLRVKVAGRPENTIPPSGPLIIVANHPTGLVDGMILEVVVRSVRPDITGMAIHLFAMIPYCRDRWIFVGRPGSRSKRKLSARGWRQSFRWLSRGGALAVFPAGRVSRFQWRRLAVADRKWSPHIAALVRRSGAPVLPIYLRGPTRINFQILGFISPLLQNARSVAAVSAFRNKDLHVTIGRLIRPVELQAFATDEEGAAFLQRQTEMLAHS
jgi:putative hemolysin